MKVNIKDSLSGLTGLTTLPLDIDRKWLKAEMAATGKSAKECIISELDKIPGILERNIREAAKVNRAFSTKSKVP